jgi:DNA-binding NtrC family response regulator
MMVLLVEDDAINGLSVANELRIAGHDVLGPVSSSRAALRLVHSHHPNLALLDMDQERRTEGIDLAGRLKRHGVASIFLTSHTDITRIQKNAIGFVAKPFRPEDIAAVIDTAKEMMKGGDDPQPRTTHGSFELFVGPP